MKNETLVRILIGIQRAERFPNEGKSWKVIFFTCSECGNEFTKKEMAKQNDNMCTYCGGEVKKDFYIDIEKL